MTINYTPEEISEILNDYFTGITHKQYIGARYVPIFGRKDEDSIEWDNTKPYEPLTIVLHQGNSYTSRQYVPIGIDIDNEQFWAITGNYNAQIEQYRRETQEVKEKIEDVEEQTDYIIAGLMDCVYTSEFERNVGETDDAFKLQRAIDYAIENGIKNILVDEWLLINHSVYIYPYNGTTQTSIHFIGNSGIENYRDYNDISKKSGFYTNLMDDFNMFEVGMPANEEDYIYTSICREITFENLIFYNDTFSNNEFLGNPTFLNVWRSQCNLKNIMMFGAYNGYYATSADKTINGNTYSNYCEYASFNGVEFYKTMNSCITSYRHDALDLEEIHIIGCMSDMARAITLYKVFSCTIKNLIAGQNSLPTSMVLCYIEESEVTVLDCYIETIGEDTDKGICFDIKNSSLLIVNGTINFDKKALIRTGNESQAHVVSFRAITVTNPWPIFILSSYNSKVSIDDYKAPAGIKLPISTSIGLISHYGIYVCRASITSTGGLNILNRVNGQRIDQILTSTVTGPRIEIVPSSTYQNLFKQFYLQSVGVHHHPNVAYAQVDDVNKICLYDSAGHTVNFADISENVVIDIVFQTM